MDFMQMLRMRNIFGGQNDPSMIGNDLPSQGGITGTMAPPSAVDFGMGSIPPPQSAPTAIASDPTSGYDAGARMRELYHPDTTAEDRFNAMVGSYPKQEDYHPTKLRMLGGMLAAVGNSFDPRGRGFRFNPQAIEFGKQTIDKPLLEKQSDWKNQIGPAQTAANLEKANNINERTLAYQTVSQELRQHAQDAKEKNDARNAEIREHRANVYEYKAMHPNAKFDFTGATVKVADPASGKVEDLGIPTGHMTKLDQMNLAHENTMKEIGARTAGAVTVENTRQGGREAIAETRGWKPYTTPQGETFMYNEITGEKRTDTPGGTPTPRSNPAGRSSKPETPYEARVRRFNAAQKLFTENPDLRKYIQLGSGTDFKVTSPAGPNDWITSGKPSAADFKKINDYIYGGDANTPVASHTPTNTPNLGTEPPARTPSGKTGGDTGDINKRAEQFLRDNGLPVTTANIEHAIRTKRVQ